MIGKKSAKPNCINPFRYGNAHGDSNDEERK